MNREPFIRFFQKFSQLFPVLLFSCALYIVHQQLQTHNLTDILKSLKSTSDQIIFYAFVLTVINYLVLAAYDYLALLFTGHKQIPIKKMIAAALLSYSISNNTGHAWAAGGSIRYRFYTKWGVPGWDILKISLFQTVTYLLGAITLGLIGSLVLPFYLAKSVNEPQEIHWVSLICLLTLSAYWAAVFFWRKPLILKGFELYLPSPAMTLWQTLVSCVDVVLSSLVMWVLLIGKVKLSFGAFLVVFVVAQVLGVISQVPGGIGVFESAFLWLIADILPSDQHLVIIGALLLYRLIYYFLPLLFAGAGLLGFELYTRRKTIVNSGKAAGKLLSNLIPQLYSTLLLLSGGILLVSGSIPANAKHMHWLHHVVPLPVLELSHLLGSLIGLLLLFLARGIYLRIDAAWYGGIVLLACGIVTSLLKGFDWREALVLLAILLLILPSHKHFFRRSSLLNISFSKSWLAAIAMVLFGTIWLGFFAYRDVEYDHDLWWEFSYEGNAPRFLRASLLIGVVTVSLGILRLLSVAPPKSFARPSQTELDEAYEIVLKSANTQGHLALLGDKYLFWSQKRNAFIMFDTTSQFWIAMGDPVGEKAEFEDLFWQFQEQADHYGVKAAFYQVSAELLPFYLDLGLSLFKLGEEASIDLNNFSLQGKLREDLRTARNKFGKLAFKFEILDEQNVEAAMPRIEQISNIWLKTKNTKEKGFSLGFFDKNYLRRTKIAAIKDAEGQIMAFANLWETSSHHELSIDLMRYDNHSPKGIMDFLFAELILWGKTEGYHWFSLGMAPLAGLERHRLAPIWHKIGAAIFDMGDKFYNFGGLYDYKAKFAPHWQPHYLAAPASLSVPYILMIITSLVARGWQGIFSK
jgi:phosphatidylglycerol lysyltransferase